MNHIRYAIHIHHLTSPRKKKEKKTRRGLKRLKSCFIISARLQGLAERDVFAVKLMVIFEGIQEGAKKKRAGLKGTCWQ